MGKKKQILKFLTTLLILTQQLSCHPIKYSPQKIKFAFTTKLTTLNKKDIDFLIIKESQNSKSLLSLPFPSIKYFSWINEDYLLLTTNEPNKNLYLIDIKKNKATKILPLTDNETVHHIPKKTLEENFSSPETPLLAFENEIYEIFILINNDLYKLNLEEHKFEQINLTKKSKLLF